MEDDDTYSLEKALSSLTDSPAEKESNPEEKDSHNHDSKSGIVETAQIKSSKINSAAGAVPERPAEAALRPALCSSRLP